jgi:hypothetical protein
MYAAGPFETVGYWRQLDDVPAGCGAGVGSWPW